jgi:electron transport complex protein RnfD
MHTVVLSGPHIHAADTVARIMFNVLLALLPAILYGIYLFGWPALNLLTVTTATCVGCEALCLWLAGKPLGFYLKDGSALLTGALLAMSLPPWAPWWMGVLGGCFAIVVAKQIFGGIGQNVFNPAMLARVVLLVSFPVEMTVWVEPRPFFSGQAPGFLESLFITFKGISDLDGVSGASILGHLRTELTQAHNLSQALQGHYSSAQAALGTLAGSLGETSEVLLMIGGLWLLRRRIITWQIPVAMLATVAILATGFNLFNPERFADATLHLLSGSLMLGAFFIATDPVTSPTTHVGRLLFGTGCGVLIYVIRTWGGYPEGVAFAVVLMNTVTPLIDHYIRPRIYGRSPRGQPLPAIAIAPKEPAATGLRRGDRD